MKALKIYTNNHPGHPDVKKSNNVCKAKLDHKRGTNHHCHLWGHKLPREGKRLPFACFHFCIPWCLKQWLAHRYTFILLRSESSFSHNCCCECNWPRIPHSTSPARCREMTKTYQHSWRKLPGGRKGSSHRHWSYSCHHILHLGFCRMGIGEKGITSASKPPLLMQKFPTPRPGTFLWGLRLVPSPVWVSVSSSQNEMSKRCKFVRSYCVCLLFFVLDDKQNFRFQLILWDLVRYISKSDGS